MSRNRPLSKIELKVTNNIRRLRTEQTIIDLLRLPPILCNETYSLTNTHIIFHFALAYIDKLS